MQRTTSVTVGLLFVAAVAAVAVLGLRPKREPELPSAAKPSTSVHATASASALPSSSALPSGDAPDLGTGTTGEPAVTEGFENFPDGGKVPELPASAPARVGFGAVIFQYRGAQNAPGDARSKEEARKKAAETIELAQKDFAAAVAKGDKGSTTDAGRLPRGVIEPPIEYVLFTLEKGKVHPEPIDTPRGYWVVRRNE
ncbi:MAG: peptidylprolyl isomerase [Myxococcales bacterium]